MFGTEADVERLLSAHSGAGNSSVYVVLHSTNGVAGGDRDAEVCNEAFQVDRDLWICRLSNALRDAVYDACESPGTPPLKHHRQYGQLYTFALFNGPWAPRQVRGPGRGDEHGGQSFATHTPNHARLCKFRTTGFGPQGEFIEAIPHACRGVTEQAFMVADQRNWLSKAEAETVRQLYIVGLGALPEK